MATSANAPNSRETLIEHCLRSLGHPVIQINVDQQQCEDRLDEALQYFTTRHYDGVQKVYAMQAGRELRVIVEAEKVSDERADELSFLISQQIQNEMQYPGQIKITVIREKRAVAFAR